MSRYTPKEAIEHALETFDHKRDCACDVGFACYFHKVEDILKSALREPDQTAKLEKLANLQNHAALALGFVKAHAVLGHSTAAIIAEGLADALDMSLSRPVSKPEPHEPGVPA